MFPLICHVFLWKLHTCTFSRLISVSVVLKYQAAGGILWPDGRNYDEYDADGNLLNEYDTPEQWNNLGTLLQSARDGLVEASSYTRTMPKVIIHNEHGANFAATQWYFDKLQPYFWDFDVIGLSYYPWWQQGNLGGLEENLVKLTDSYGKETALVEIAYPWTLDAQDDYDNIVQKEGTLYSGYPPNEEGQLQFIVDICEIVADAGGLGVMYFAPEWVVSPDFPSAWENVALFDRNGQVLPALAALGNSSTAIEPTKAPIEPTKSPTQAPPIEFTLSSGGCTMYDNLCLVVTLLAGSYALLL